MKEESLISPKDTPVADREYIKRVTPLQNWIVEQSSEE